MTSMAVQPARACSSKRGGWGPAPTPPTLSSASRSMRKPSIFPTKCMPSARAAEAVSRSWSLFSVATFDILLSRLLLLIKIRTNTNLLIMYLVPRCDEPGTMLKCRQVDQPLEPSHHEVAKANQKNERHDQQHDPS